MLQNYLCPLSLSKYSPLHLVVLMLLSVVIRHLIVVFSLFVRICFNLSVIVEFSVRPTLLVTEKCLRRAGFNSTSLALRTKFIESTKAKITHISPPFRKHNVVGCFFFFRMVVHLQVRCFPLYLRWLLGQSICPTLKTLSTL